MNKPALLCAILLSAAAASFAVAAPAQADAAPSEIYVPGDFDHPYSDTRSGGHDTLDGSALHVLTDSNTSLDKVAEYITTETPLAAVGEPKLDYENTSGGGIPGFQLIVDFDGTGTEDGILVGEPGAYGNDWWLSNRAAPFVKDSAPVVGPGFGSQWHGTLDQWRASFPSATVRHFGFSLGSGVKGDGILNAITFAGVRSTFAATPVPGDQPPAEVRATSSVVADCPSGSVTTTTVTTTTAAQLQHFAWVPGTASAVTTSATRAGTTAELSACPAASAGTTAPTSTGTAGQTSTVPAAYPATAAPASAVLSDPVSTLASTGTTDTTPALLAAGASLAFGSLLLAVPLIRRRRVAASR